MTPEIAFVLALVLAAVVLFASEKLRVDLVALIVMSILLGSGIVTPQEALAGFSNPATITVAAMFVLSAGLTRTGAVTLAGAALVRLSAGRVSVALAAVMIVAAVLSAFVNNTAVVAMFIPVVIGLSREVKVSSSRLLMPLSFAAMFGGVCTLVGTSTNLLVDSIAQRHGVRGFGLFEFAPLGLVLMAAGMIYMFVAGRRLIPERRPGGGLAGSFGLKDYLTEIELTADAACVSHPLGDNALMRDLDLDVLEVTREGRRVVMPRRDFLLQERDVLLVRCGVDELARLKERPGIRLHPDVRVSDEDLSSEEVMLVEAIIAPESDYAGMSARAVRFQHRFGAAVLALRHRGGLAGTKLREARLRAGDALLLQLPRENLDLLQADDNFVVVSEVAMPAVRRKLPLAVAIMAGVVALAAFGLQPIVVTAVAGAVVMVLARCLTLEEAYEAVEWKVVFLLAGVLTLGMALEKSGAAPLLAGALLKTVGVWGPIAMISAIYLTTSLATELMSNNATAALLVPVALAAARDMGADARPFLMAVCFAASASFMTPVGYQTNTLIYGPGQYRYADFLRVGTPLNVLFWILSSVLIPWFWPPFPR